MNKSTATILLALTCAVAGNPARGAKAAPRREPRRASFAAVTRRVAPRGPASNPFAQAAAADPASGVFEPKRRVSLLDEFAARVAAPRRPSRAAVSGDANPFLSLPDPPEARHQARTAASGAPSELARLKSRVTQLERILERDPKVLTDRELDSYGTKTSNRGSAFYQEQQRRKGPEKPLSGVQLYEKCANTVVSVIATRNSGAVTGTGFLSAIGTVTTNFHVIAQATAVRVQMPDGTTASVEAVDWADRDRDLASVRLAGNFKNSKGEATHPVADDGFASMFGAELQPVGTPVYVIGDPVGLQRSLASGLISGIRQFRGMTTVYQITAPVSPGNSGSPVFDQFGHVVAVVTSTLGYAQNVNFCVPIDYLRPGQVQANMPLSEWVGYSKDLAGGSLGGEQGNVPPDTEAFLKKAREQAAKPPDPAAAAPETSLRGLTGVEVVVESMAKEVEDAGLTEAQLQTDVELRLRQLGVKVLTEEERVNTVGCAYLYLNVTAIPQDNLLTYTVNLSLNQNAYLERNGSRVFGADTWNARCVGRNGADGVRQGVREKVEEFCSDYLKVNPHGPNK